MKIHPYDPNATDDLPRLDADQERYIRMMLAEQTHAVCNASTMSAGKTVITAEWIIRSGVKRVLIVGVKDTVGGWAETLADQSDGAIQLRPISATKVGKANYAAMLAGEDGVFFSGSQYLTRQDWRYEPQEDAEGNLVLKMDKKTGEPEFKDQALPTVPGLPAVVWQLGAHGPVQRVFKQVTRRVRTFAYKKMKSLDALVVDEIHIVAANRKNVARTTLMGIKTDWRIALSGTFYGNKFENSWSVTKWLWPDLMPNSFHTWKDEWCAQDVQRKENGKPVYITDRHGNKATIPLITGEKVPGTFVSTLPCYFRIEAAERPPEPEKVYVDLSPIQRAQYDQMERDMLTWLRSRHPQASNDELMPLMAEVDIAKRVRLRTITLGELSMDENEEAFFASDARSTKIDALAGILHHYGQQKVVIYTHSKKFANLVTARMKAAGLSVAAWTGDVNSATRDQIKKDFLQPLEAGGLQYIVAVIAAFGTGLDGFQRVCSKIVWLSEVEGDAVINDQAVHRIWRRGGDKENFQHVKILARETYDEGILNALRVKSTNMQNTMRKAA